MTGNIYEVRNISQIDNKNIKLGKTFKYGDNYHLTNIYYMENGSIDNTGKESEAKKQESVDEGFVFSFVRFFFFL